MNSRLGLALAAVLTAFVGGLLAPLLTAQSLAEVAKQEEERRKGVKDSSKVYTNADLGSAGAATPATAPAPAAEATRPSGVAEKAKESDKIKEPDKAKAPDKDKEPVKDQTYWSGRLKALQAQLERDQTFAEALQSRINVLSADFVNRDDPAQRAIIARDRQKAIDELDRLKKAIEADKQAVSDFQEEARRAGVPPGWLRP